MSARRDAARMIADSMAQQAAIEFGMAMDAAQQGPAHCTFRDSGEGTSEGAGCESGNNPK